MTASNYLAPDGFRYGIRFRDGSVASWWNGRTQRRRVFDAIEEWRARALAGPFARNYLPNDHLVVRRRSPDDPWEVVEAVTCAGCGRLGDPDDAPRWRLTDAPWCPSCAWLA